MNTQEIFTVILVLTALFAYFNHRLIKWPPTIGIMVLSLLSSILLIIAGNAGLLLSAKATQFVNALDFQNVLMNVMLSFLLFAGSIHIKASALKQELWPVAILATIGTLLSTFLVGIMVMFLFGWFGLPVPFIYCLLFGALISPTDPIAVIGILKQAKMPPSLEIKIQGESLFNDGIAVVIFVTITEIAASGTGHADVWSVGKLFLQEAVGGLLFGALLGYTGYLLLKGVDDYKVEVLVTLAIVAGGYALANQLHVSGPLAMVVAGIITGNKVKHEVMSAQTQDYLDKFWELIDEILNAVLFLLIGFEMLVIKINAVILVIGFVCIGLVLLARWISVIVPVALLRYKISFEKNAVTLLTWGGLRGGISVALALSLPHHMYKDEFLLMTYIVVVFSILVQGLTIGKVAVKTSR